MLSGCMKNERFLSRDTCCECPLSFLMRLLSKMAETLVITPGENDDAHHHCCVLIDHFEHTFWNV